MHHQFLPASPEHFPPAAWPVPSPHALLDQQGEWRRRARHGGHAGVAGYGQVQWWLALLIAIVCALSVTWPALAQEAPAEESTAIYVVQPGDTLSEIAKAHGTDTETLRRLNGLGDVDFVWVGQRLHLPTPVTQEAEQSAAAEATGQPTAAAGDPTAERPTATATAAAIPTATATPTVAPSPTATAKPDLSGTIIEEYAPVVSQSERSGIHIVQPGDTLSRVAVRYQTTLAHLIEFNQISPAQRLHVGQALVVPIAGGAVAPEAEVEPIIHIVKAGDYLSTIAKQYDVPMAALAQVNGIGNRDVIVAGQRLRIPAAADLAASELLDSASFQMGRDGYHVHTNFPTLTEKWIDVDLSEQRLIAYRGRKPIKSFLISSGRPGTPTVTGVFRIWAKTPLQDMYAGNRAAGYAYYLEDVPWVQYFYKDYGLHAAYWHNNFGEPMSHGCINLSLENAKWLFEWASPTMSAAYGWFISDEENPGTLVVVHD